MIWKNIEIHNVSEIIADEHGITWLRLPKSTYDKLESQSERDKCHNSTGVELRFVMNSDKVTLRMEAISDVKYLSTFNVFRGDIQSTWEDHEINRFVDQKVCNFEISKSKNIDLLQRMSKQSGTQWSPEVVRILFDRGQYRIIDVIGDVRAPHKNEMPSKTIINYGSSITHGSNSITACHSWPSVLAHNLNMDSRNLGMAGCCCLDPELVDYIADEGERGNWDIATLELGINVLGWEKSKIEQRVTNTLRQIATRNPQKPIFAISPFYCCDDFNNENKANLWRSTIDEVVTRENLPNVTLVNGLDILGDMSLISADEVHPNIYGVAQIAARLTNVIKKHVKFPH